MRRVQLGHLVEGTEPVTIERGATVQDAAKKMCQANKGAILIVAEGRLHGIFTERDLLNRVVAVGKDPQATKIDDVMSGYLVVGRPADDFQTGLRRMISTACRHLPVVDKDRVVGVVSRRDLMAMDILTMEEEMDRHDPASLFI
jgi:CBS domain-containing protein